MSCTSSLTNLKEQIRYSAYSLILVILVGCSSRTNYSELENMNRIQEDNNIKSGLELVLVEGGDFIMGGHDNVDDGAPPEVRLADECPHPATVDDFYIAKYEVTRLDWKSVMGDNPMLAEGCDECPISSITWIEIQQFIEKLNAKTGEQYRLPTEAEWEYAAKGGQLSQEYLYSGSNLVEEVAWFSGNSDGVAHGVGRLKPNELGIYDMSGNIWEYCSSIKSPYPCDTLGKNYNVPVLRGGTFSSRPHSVRVRDRNGRDKNTRLPTLGFRLAKS